MPLMNYPRNKIFGGSICSKCECEVDNRVPKFLLVFICTLSPDLLLLKWISTIAGYFEMDLLLRAACVDGAECKEGINQLAILE
jgi:hypothetical protein